MARLPQGVYIKKDGRLEKHFDIEGKRYYASGRTTKEVQAKEQEIRERVKHGLYRDNNNITLDQYFKEWIVERAKNIKGNTLKGYENKYNKHISPVIGSRKVQKIETREVKLVRDKAEKKLKSSTVNNIMAVLKVVLQYAVKDRIISINPAVGVDMLKAPDDELKAADTIHRALTEDEQKAFMKEAKSSYYFGVFGLMLCTGMRNGEACALTWKDIDYQNNVIHVNKTVTCTKAGGLTIGSPKSKAGMRDIPITKSIKKVLEDQKALTGNIFSIDRNDRVFRGINGGIIQGGTLNLEIDRILKRLEAAGTVIEHFTTHAFRDTFATRYIEQGGQAQTLKSILGHSSLAMTMDLYAHVLPNTKQEEMDKINIAM